MQFGVIHAPCDRFGAQRGHIDITRPWPELASLEQRQFGAADQRVGLTAMIGRERDPDMARQTMFDAIKKAGGEKIKFTIDPDAGHDCWTKAYNDPALYRWLLEQKRD